MPPKFFITHSWKDIEFARKLCDDLHANGLAGFFDAYSIKPGDMVPSEIARGLEACDIYVPILSYAALASPWCDEEINAALTLGKMPGRNGRPRIIPILIEHCQDKMSVFLHNRLYIVFANRYNDAFHELLTKGFGVPVASPGLAVASPVQQVKLTVPRKAIALPRTKIGKDGKEMILIPAGEFMMGSDVSDNEKPPHKVYLDAFYIARYPVTNAEYKKFVDETKHKVPDHWQSGQIPSGKENHPVVYVNWDDANAYAQWVSARLPTEAEWEKAVSWDDAKQEKRMYPWGDQFDANKCNTSESGIKDTTLVGKYSLQGDSSYGVGDMVGNVWEWCADWYDANYYNNSPEKNPLGPASGQTRVWRGGSWSHDRGYARGAFRYGHSPVSWYNHVGFRFVMSSSLKSFISERFA